MSENMSKDNILSMYNKNRRSLVLAIDRIHELEEALRFCRAYGIKDVDTGVLNKRSGVIKLLKELGFKEIKSDSINHTKLLLEL